VERDGAQRWLRRSNLAKPLREEDVVRAVRLAWFYWNLGKGTTTVQERRI
jgi:hypothetical protein